MPLLILFVVVPIIEIYFLIQVGGAIGVLPTILLVIATAFLGTALLRQQGMSTMRRYQENVQQGKMPAKELLEGLALLIGGVLLLTPGFFTDAIGFSLLIPITRQGMIKWILSKVNFQMMGASSHSYHQQGQGPRPSGDGNVYEGEYSSPKDESSDSDRFPPNRF